MISSEGRNGLCISVQTESNGAHTRSALAGFSSPMFSVVKSEPMDEAVDDHDESLSRDLTAQKEKHDAEIARLRGTYDAQIEKLRQELTFYRSFLNINEGGEKAALSSSSSSSPSDAASKQAQLTSENVKLKKQIDLLMANYKIVTREIQEAREYLLALLADSD